MNDDFPKRLAAENIAFSVAESDLFAASLDHTRYSFLPEIVVKPVDCAEISKTLKTAFDTDTPVTVRGCGTGCAGGSIPTCNGAVLDLSAINFIDIDPIARVAHVGAGAVTADIDAAASQHGLFYAPDPSSHKYCSIGGNIACNAGGLRAAKYGTTRENLLSLVAYLADGTRLDCARPLKKFSAGMNLRDMFVGSEGTLGVVAQAWLKLLPKPKSRKVALAFFDGDDKGFSAVERVMLSRLQPSVLEFMDAETVSCLRRRISDISIPEGSCALLAEFDGNEVEACEDCREFIALFPSNARRASNEAESETLWRVRRISSSAMYEIADSKISQDIVLPFKAVRDFFVFFKALGTSLNLSTPVFGHAADGNYHIHLMYNSAKAGARERALKGMDAAIVKTIELGGAVSGEHGIGFLKSKYMPLQHSAQELAVMQAVKKTLDPKNILNRGKLYESSDISRLKPLTGIKLKWDK